MCSTENELEESVLVSEYSESISFKAIRNEVSNKIRVKSVPNTCQIELIFVYLSVKYLEVFSCFFSKI